MGIRTQPLSALAHAVRGDQSSICGSIVYAERVQMFPMHPLCGALPAPYVPVRVTRGDLRLLAAEPHSIARLLFPSQCLSGTILVTLCSMVWDCRVSRAGPMHFYWPSYSLPFVSSTVFP